MALDDRPAPRDTGHVPLVVDALTAADLPTADRIFRLAFGTFVGLPQPLDFAGDADWVRTRFHAAPEAAFAARRDGELVGSCFVARWGSFGFFGPLSVRPDCWGAGVANALLEPVSVLLGPPLTLAGLFTFAQSPLHVRLYQRHGFWPRYLTAIMVRAADGAPRLDPPPAVRRFGTLAPAAQADALAQAASLAGAIYPGLDLRAEILSVERQHLGETLLVDGADGLAGIAVCHGGAGTEAGSGVCYVKAAAAAPGPEAPAAFRRLLAACEAWATERGYGQVCAGVNTARTAAYRALLAGGYRTVIQGVAMQRPEVEGFNRPDAFVLDDWR